jgi:NADH-quinone oxidoreductase subunit H
VLKVAIVVFMQMTIRWTLPRFRYDQIMKLGWTVLLPLSLLNIFVTGVALLFLNTR